MTIKIQPVRNRNIPLRDEIRRFKKANVEQIRHQFGELGVDIFEKKEKISILDEKDIKRSKNIFYRIKSWWSGDSLQDFEEGDTMRKAVFKYAGNKDAGLVNDIETKFGKRGLEELESLRRLGYVSI